MIEKERKGKWKWGREESRKLERVALLCFICIISNRIELNEMEWNWINEIIGGVEVYVDVNVETIGDEATRQHNMI